ncbi:hypothetical protein TKK_0004604 [Trichogramma kaykai]
MSVNETTYYTKINKEEYVFTWVISDWPSEPSTMKESRISSPSFNVGSNKQFEFYLQLLERPGSQFCSYDGSWGDLKLCCSMRNTELPCKYKISVIKDQQIFITHTGDFTIGSPNLCVIFKLNAEESKKFVSSNGTIIFRSEFSILSGYHTISQNYECDDKNKVPKLQLPKFQSVFLDEKLSDVKLRSACGKEIPAHRVLLATASPVFNAMFSHDMLENNRKLVNMSDVSFAAAIEMLRFVYTGRIEYSDIFLIIDLLAAADKYQIDELKNECEKILSANLTSRNAVDILQVADRYSLRSLKKKAVDFVKNNIGQSSNSDEVGSLILSMAQFLSK